MVFVVEPFLPSKCKVLNSNPSTTKKKKKKKEKDLRLSIQVSGSVLSQGPVIDPQH
jgi:hypothetical protein